MSGNVSVKMDEEICRRLEKMAKKPDKSPNAYINEAVEFFVYTTELNPRFGTEPDKIRPVVVIQTDSEYCKSQHDHLPYHITDQSGVGSPSGTCVKGRSRVLHTMTYFKTY